MEYLAATLVGVGVGELATLTGVGKAFGATLCPDLCKDSQLKGVGGYYTPFCEDALGRGHGQGSAARAEEGVAIGPCPTSGEVRKSSSL